MLLELPRPRMRVLALVVALLLGLSACIGPVDGPFAPFIDNRTEEPLTVQAIRDDDGYTFTATGVVDESVDPGESDELGMFASRCTEGHRLIALTLEGEEMASTTESLCVGDRWIIEGKDVTRIER